MSKIQSDCYMCLRHPTLNLEDFQCATAWTANGACSIFVKSTYIAWLAQIGAKQSPTLPLPALPLLNNLAQCDKGQYRATVQPYECTPCPKGTYRSTVGGFGVSDCEKVKTDYRMVGYVGSSGATDEEQCGANSVPNAQGTDCTACPSGTIETSDGTCSIRANTNATIAIPLGRFSVTRTNATLPFLFIESATKVKACAVTIARKSPSINLADKALAMVDAAQTTVDSIQCAPDNVDCIAFKAANEAMAAVAHCAWQRFSRCNATELASKGDAAKAAAGTAAIDVENITRSVDATLRIVTNAVNSTANILTYIYAIGVIAISTEVGALYFNGTNLNASSIARALPITGVWTSLLSIQGASLFLLSSIEVPAETVQSAIAVVEGTACGTNSTECSTLVATGNAVNEVRICAEALFDHCNLANLAGVASASASAYSVTYAHAVLYDEVGANFTQLAGNVSIIALSAYASAIRVLTTAASGKLFAAEIDYFGVGANTDPLRQADQSLIDEFVYSDQVSVGECVDVSIEGSGDIRGYNFSQVAGFSSNGEELLKAIGRVGSFFNESLPALPANSTTYVASSSNLAVIEQNGQFTLAYADGPLVMPFHFAPTCTNLNAMPINTTMGEICFVLE